MSPLFQIAIALLLVTLPGHVLAQRADFQVSIRVLPAQVATDIPTELPLPPGTRILPPGKHASRLLFDGSPGAARRFYEDTLPDLGFHRTRRTATGEVWERADISAELSFHPVVGGKEATGILLMISPRASAG
jgi:hypothetical protein